LPPMRCCQASLPDLASRQVATPLSLTIVEQVIDDEGEG
jgi:hypothetical protein